MQSINTGAFVKSGLNRLTGLSSIDAGYDAFADKMLIIGPLKLGHDARTLCNQLSKSTVLRL